MKLILFLVAVYYGNCRVFLGSFLDPELYIQFTKDKGFGMYSSKAVMKDDVVLKIQKNLIIDIKASRNITNLIKDYPPEVQLMVCLIYESAYPTSYFFEQYIKSLPSEFSNFPSWTTTEISLFQDDEDYLFMQEYEMLKKSLKNTNYKSLLSWESWIYSLSIVASRAFLYKTHNDQYPVLIPILDIVNYDSCYVPNLKSGFKINEKNEFILKSEREFKAGEEFVWSYGMKDSNRGLLWSYGFTVENNPYNCIDVGKNHFCNHNKDQFLLNLDLNTSSFLLENITSQIRQHKKLINLSYDYEIRDQIINIFKEELALMEEFHIKLLSIFTTL